MPLTYADLMQQINELANKYCSYCQGTMPCQKAACQIEKQRMDLLLTVISDLSTRHDKDDPKILARYGKILVDAAPPSAPNIKGKV